LDRSKWPKKTNPCFGDKQVCVLAKELDMCVCVCVCLSVSSSVHRLCEYFISGNCDSICSKFKSLAAAVNRLVICTAECEPSFSTMNSTISCV
jgi:hypothetical protein